MRQPRQLDPPQAATLAEQRRVARAMRGRYVHFVHRPDTCYHVSSVNEDAGMICIDGMVGEFAPHLFCIKETH